uniref:Uncharacterized protein n=1 Tax=Rhizophora mucronata TaxID=61149 RepID=A0A2P2MHH5_RHIMU
MDLCYYLFRPPKECASLQSHDLQYLQTVQIVN